MKPLIYAAIGFSLLGSTAAMAQRGDHGRGDNDRHSENQREQHDWRGEGRYIAQPNMDHPRWSMGDRVPDHYRHNEYVVGDWQQRNLRAPPYGYHWLRNDNDQYVLAAVRSGIIADIVGQEMFRNDYRWSQGQRLSGGYLDHRYVVQDWRVRGLHYPPRGYHWVQINNQVMLTALAGGMIAEVISNTR